MNFIPALFPKLRFIILSDRLGGGGGNIGKQAHLLHELYGVLTPGAPLALPEIDTIMTARSAAPEIGRPVREVGEASFPVPRRPLSGETSPAHGAAVESSR